MKITNPGGHLDQMMRQTRAHHVQLSSMADLKANMLLTMSSLVLTVAAPRVLTPEFRLAGIVLVVSCIATIALAAYAAMPKLPLRRRHNDLEATHRGNFNLLFFGDFTRLTYEEFEAEMEKMMNDPSAAYEAQVREVYALGVFLATKKYRFLRLAYLSFIAGLVGSGVVMAVTSLWR
ncbi:MAG: hypothetical protein HY301_17180 [Verrucomicrobia bacterium]|nr:hypothetical protein [Verrucomicrobiota bacterium]